MNKLTRAVFLRLHCISRASDEVQVPGDEVILQPRIDSKPCKTYGEPGSSLRMNVFRVLGGTSLYSHIMSTAQNECAS